MTVTDSCGFMQSSEGIPFQIATEMEFMGAILDLSVVDWNLFGFWNGRASIFLTFDPRPCKPRISFRRPRSPNEPQTIQASSPISSLCHLPSPPRASKMHAAPPADLTESKLGSPLVILIF
jgi:hypothetical protein